MAGELNAVGFPSDSTVRDKSWWSHRHVQPAELWRRRHTGPSPGKGEVQCLCDPVGQQDLQATKTSLNDCNVKPGAVIPRLRLRLTFRECRQGCNDHRNHPAGSLSTTSCWRRRWEKKPSTTLFNVINRVQDHRCARLRVTRLLPSRQRSPSCIRNLW